MSVTIEDLQDESASASQFAGMTQLHATEPIPFKFERTETAITFTNYLGIEILLNIS